MAKPQRSTSLYPHPFSAAYWRDAASELKSTRMLVFAALMIALRVALKLARIPIAPNLYINTAFVANAMGAMVFGPVVAALGAVVSDLLGVIITGDLATYFPPMVLTEVAGSLLFALFLYRAKVTPVRVMLSRFCICFFVNVLLQTPLMMWYYQVYYNGSSYVLTVPSILKNLFMFPLETVVLSLFLGMIQPITYRMKLTYAAPTDMKFTKRQIATLLVLVLLGAGCVVSYLFYHYENTSVTTGYSTQERMETNKTMTQIVEARDVSFDGDTVVCIVDSAYRPLFSKETEYTLSVYLLDEEAFAAGQAADEKYTMDTLWAYSKSGPKKDPYGSLVKVGTVTLTYHEGEKNVLTYSMEYLQ